MIALTECALRGTIRIASGAYSEKSLWPGRIARVSGASVALLGIVVLCGWIFDISFVKSVLPGLTDMKVNTALCFMVAGAAVWASAARIWTCHDTVRAVSASLVIVVGLATIVEYLSGRNLGIDELFVQDFRYLELGLLHPGRMASATSVAFVMVGGSLLLRSGRRVIVSQVLACTAASRQTRWKASRAGCNS